MHYEITKQRRKQCTALCGESSQMCPTLASCLHSGASCLHGPHQGAKKSTSQISPASRSCTSRSNISGVRLSTGGLRVSCQINTAHSVHCACILPVTLSTGGWGCPAKSTQYTQYMYMYPASHTEHWGVECVLPMSTQYMYPASHTEHWGVECVLPMSTQYMYVYPARHTVHWGVECVLPMSTQYMYMYPARHTVHWGLRVSCQCQHSTHSTLYMYSASHTEQWGWMCAANVNKVHSVMYMYPASHTEHWGVECVLPMSTQYTQYMYMYPASHTEHCGVEGVLPNQHSTCPCILPIRGEGLVPTSTQYTTQHMYKHPASRAVHWEGKGGGGRRLSCQCQHSRGSVHVQASCHVGWLKKIELNWTELSVRLIFHIYGTPPWQITCLRSCLWELAAVKTTGTCSAHKGGDEIWMAEPQFAGFPATVIPTCSHAEMSSIWQKGLNRTSCLDEVHQSCCTMVAAELVGDCLVVENGGGVWPYIVLKHNKNQTTFKTITRAIINNNDHNMLKFDSLGYIQVYPKMKMP